jgi:hypothetical protein
MKLKKYLKEEAVVVEDFIWRAYFQNWKKTKTKKKENRNNFLSF